MMLKEFIWDMFFKNDKAFVLSRIDTDEQLTDALTRVDDLIIALAYETTSKEELLARIDELEAITYDTDAELEDYWNNRREKTRWIHKCRPVPNDSTKNLSVDPRIFYQNDCLLPKMVGIDYDQLALFCFNYVKKNIRYTKDEKEYWQFAYETLNRGRGDCEDGAILMANMMILSGVPYWRVRLNAGDVKGGGHAYVTYLREKDNTWYILDWCYWPDESKNFGKKWKDAEKYFGIWGSWNTKHIYGERPE